MGRFCLFSFIFQLPFYTLVFSEWGCFFLLVRLGRGDTKDFLSLSKKVLVTLIRFICSFFSTARRTNQEAPPQLSGACLYSNPPLLLSLRVFLTPPSLRTPPLYFAAQNTEEEGESNPPLIADSINSFYCFCFNPFALRALSLYFTMQNTP